MDQNNRPDRNFAGSILLGLWLGLVLWVCLSGCATFPSESAEQLDASREYRMDLDMEVNGQRGKGMIKVFKSDRYDIKVRAPGSAEIVTLNTCHREQVLYKQSDKFFISFVPTETELQGYCPVVISAYAPKFRYAVGFVDFQDLTLSARMLCNGEEINSDGVTVCQSREGMAQELVFASETKAATAPEGCPQPKPKSGLRFELKLGKGRCVYLFGTADGQRHRLTTFGYQEFQLQR